MWGKYYFIVRKWSQRESGAFDCIQQTSDVLFCFKVGGISYHPWREDTFNELRENHINAARYTTPVRRSDETQATGSLRTGGSRLAAGGALGDGYRTYASHDATSVSGVNAFFGTAMVRYAINLAIILKL